MLVYRSNKYHGQSGSNNRHLSSCRLEAGRPRSRCWEARLIPRCLPLAGSQLPASCAPPPPTSATMSPLHRCRQRASGLCTSYKDVDPARPGPALWPHLTFITSLIFQRVFWAVLGLCCGVWAQWLFSTVLAVL